MSTPQEVAQALDSVGYLPSTEIAAAVFLAQKLGKPILVEGPAGTGKTELAKAVARIANAELIRLQCYEGLDESRALYEWDYQKQLLAIQAAKLADAQSEETIESQIFSEKYLLERPLLQAIRNSDSTVLLIDEVDRLEVETEALLLEVLSDFQVSIPEIGTVQAIRQPTVILTSNNTRELSEALKRRCLFLYLGYPSKDRERDIIARKVPNIEEQLASKLVEIVAYLRSEIDLKKAPSISEVIDWAQALVVLNIKELDQAQIKQGLPILLKYVDDIESAKAQLSSVNVPG